LSKVDILRRILLHLLTTGYGIVSRVTPVHTALRNCTRDEGGPFEVGNQVLLKQPQAAKAMALPIGLSSATCFGSRKS
jgi:hypothetical protein